MKMVLIEQTFESHKLKATHLYVKYDSCINGDRLSKEPGTLKWVLFNNFSDLHQGHITETERNIS